MITINGVDFKSFNFPVGEKHIIIKNIGDLPRIDIEFEFSLAEIRSNLL